ncbi:hypothetical protein D9F09_14145, partial [Escherichia coli]|nr:hypothetical protein [Escherichia coli]MIB04049.1 hypothetical protein [Escherichia coli]
VSIFFVCRCNTPMLIRLNPGAWIYHGYITMFRYSIGQDGPLHFCERDVSIAGLLSDSSDKYKASA